MLGCALARQGRHAEAVVALREALAAPGSHPSYRRALGESLWRLSQFEEAAESFSQVLREDPRDAEAANGLGSVPPAARKGEGSRPGPAPRPAGGQRPHRLALEPRGRPHGRRRPGRGRANPAPGGEGPSRRPSPRRNLGRALLARGEKEEALACFREVLRLTGGDDAVGHMDLGDALFAAGRHEEAEAEYERGISLEPAVVAVARGQPHRLAGHPAEPRPGESSAQRAGAEPAHRSGSGVLAGRPCLEARARFSRTHPRPPDLDRGGVGAGPARGPRRPRSCCPTTWPTTASTTSSCVWPANPTTTMAACAKRPCAPSIVYGRDRYVRARRRPRGRAPPGATRGVRLRGADGAAPRPRHPDSLPDAGRGAVLARAALP